MVVPKDKLGGFILFADEFNRYEPFAASAYDYATVDEARPDDTGQCAIDAYREEGNASHDERRVLIHSDHVYGNRRPASFTFNLQHAAESWRDWLYDYAAGMAAAGNEDHTFEVAASLEVRAVTTDFDPAAITWGSAYGLGSPLTFSQTSLAQALGIHYFTVHVEAPVPPNDPATPVPFRVWAGLAQEEALPNVIVSGAGSGWNDLDAIYGFEVALTLSGSYRIPYWPWTGALDRHWVRYEGNAGTALCYAIR